MHLVEETIASAAVASETQHVARGLRGRSYAH
jgi:hypothetical protein